MRKMLITILMTLVAGLAWATGAGESGTAEDGPVTLQVWGGVPEENGPGDLIAAFEDLNPTITVDYTRFVNDDEGNLRLDTALIAGGQVDVYFTYRNDSIARRAGSGNARALEPLAAADGMDLEATFGDLSYATVDGQAYAIPTNKGPQFFMVNKDMFDAAGIEIPTRWNADEFRAIARRLTTGSGQEKVHGVMYPTWPQLLMLGAMSALGPNAYLTDDGNAANFDHPLFSEFVQLRHDMQYEDESELPYVNIQAQNLSDAAEFLNGRVAMLYTGTWRVRSVTDLESFPHDFVVGFAPYFSMTDDQERLYNEGSPGDWAMIAGDTRNENAAWDFITYWATEGIDPMVSKGGKIPAWTGYPADRVTESMLGDNPERLFDVESFERVILGSPLYSYQPTTDIARTVYNDMRSVLREEVELYFIGDQTLEQAMTVIDRRVTELVRNAQ